MNLQERVLEEARSWLGTPYRHQCSIKGAGCDCLGLVRGVYRALHGFEPQQPPPYTPDWAEACGEETLLHAARAYLIEKHSAQMAPGDVLLFHPRSNAPAKHVAILSSPVNENNGRMIHAYWGRAVCETSFSHWWRARLAGVFVFPDGYTNESALSSSK